MKDTNIIKTVVKFFRQNLKGIIIVIVLAIVVAIVVSIKLSTKHIDARKDNNSKAVVTILILNKDDQFISSGSGIFINSDGELVTNYHVIGAYLFNNNYKIVAKLSTGTESRSPKLIAINKGYDIVILKFDAKNLNFIKTDNNDKVYNGEKVSTIGTPLDFENSTSEGIISYPSRKIGNMDFIQFTAPISAGNSGGGLFDSKGNLIGITTSSVVPTSNGEAAQNLNFAIPVKYVNKTKGRENELSKDSSDFYYSEGVKYYGKKEYKKAINYLKKAIIENKNYTDAYIQLSNIYYDQQNYKEEIDVLEQAKKQKPTNPETNFNLGMAYEDIGKFDSAITLYKKALELQPKYKDALFEICLLDLVSGKKEEALKYVPRLRTLDFGIAKEIEMLANKIK